MTTYLIDYENRPQKNDGNGLSGADKLKATDLVVVFIGRSSVVPTAFLNVCVNKSPARMEFHKCRKVAQNYLDFQLSSYLGWLMGATLETDYRIVCSDKGFQALVDLWTQRRPDVHIELQPSIIPAKPVKQQKASKPSGGLEKLAAAIGVSAAPDKASKNDPPESIRRQLRAIIKGQQLKNYNFGVLYRVFRISKNKISFGMRVRKLFDAEMLARIKPQLMEAFERYVQMR